MRAGQAYVDQTAHIQRRLEEPIKYALKTSRASFTRQTE